MCDLILFYFNTSLDAVYIRKAPNERVNEFISNIIELYYSIYNYNEEIGSALVRNDLNLSQNMIYFHPE